MESRHLVTDRTIVAAKASQEARAQLARINWAALPDTLRSMGWTPSPELLKALELPLSDLSSHTLITVRGALATVGDRARRRRTRYSKTIEAMCVEIVGLTGAALTLLDTAGST